MNKEEQLQFIKDNYPAYTNHVSKRRIRHDFFKNISIELQAYLLGFYASDGSADEKRKTMRVCLQQDDSEIVYLFKDTISSDARIYSIPPKEYTGRGGVKIQGHGAFGVDITSSVLVQDLVDLGFGYDKSHGELHLPNIDNKLLRHFIRGYFDGDGCITGGIAREKGKKDRFRKYFQIDAKYSLILLEIQKFFSIYDIKVNINYIKRDDMYRLVTSSKKEVEKIFHLLYDNSYFYLGRKFNKFSHYVNTEDLQLIAEACNAQEVNVNESNNPPKSSEHLKTDENVR